MVEIIVRTIKDKTKANVYCRYCEVVVRGGAIKTITNDAEQIEFLCPGCDWELLPPVNRFEYYGIETESNE